MSLIPVAIAFACIVMVGLLLVNLWRAPEGYEDGTGYHAGPVPKQVSDRTREAA